MVGLLLAGTFLALPDLPPPDGPYPVVSRSFSLALAKDAIPIKIQIWYPASHGSTSGMARYEAPPKVVGRWRSLLARLARTHVYADGMPALPAKKPLRVIFYECGLEGHRLENFALCADLASHGALVVAMDNYDASRGAGKALHPNADFSTPQAATTTHHLLSRAIAERTTLLERVSNALASLHGSQADSTLVRLAGLADWSQCDIFGFSLGGAVALEAATRLPRFQRAANMDGLILRCSHQTAESEYSTFAAAPLFLDQRMPHFLKARSLPATPCPGRTLNEVIISSEREIRKIIARTGAQRIVLDEAGHEDFTDSPFLDPLRLFRSQQRLSIHHRLRLALAHYFTLQTPCRPGPTALLRGQDGKAYDFGS